MTTYSDADIHEALYRDRDACDNWIRVSPDVEPWQLQPASIDLRLGTSFLSLVPAPWVDMRDRSALTRGVSVNSDADSYVELKPGDLVLGSTIERIEVGPKIWAKIEGKSSLGRMGLAVHVTAGFVDPGFRGQVTLELFNISPSPIRLRPGLAICQVAFGECLTRAKRPYGTAGLGSHYQDQAGAVPVRA